VEGNGSGKQAWGGIAEKATNKKNKTLLTQREKWGPAQKKAQTARPGGAHSRAARGPGGAFGRSWGAKGPGVTKKRFTDRQPWTPDHCRFSHPHCGASEGPRTTFSKHAKGGKRIQTKGHEEVAGHQKKGGKKWVMGDIFYPGGEGGKKSPAPKPGRSGATPGCVCRGGPTLNRRTPLSGVSRAQAFNRLWGFGGPAPARGRTSGQDVHPTPARGGGGAPNRTGPHFPGFCGH